MREPPRAAPIKMLVLTDFLDSVEDLHKIRNIYALLNIHRGTKVPIFKF